MRKISFISKMLSVNDSDWKVVLDPQCRVDREAFELIKKHSHFYRPTKEYWIKGEVFPELISMGYLLVIDGVVCKFASKIRERVLQTAWAPASEKFAANAARMPVLVQTVRELNAQLNELLKPYHKLVDLIHTSPQVSSKSDRGRGEALVFNQNIEMYAECVTISEWYEPSHEHFTTRETHCVSNNAELKALFAECNQVYPAYKKAAEALKQAESELRNIHFSAHASDEYRTSKAAA